MVNLAGFVGHGEGEHGQAVKDVHADTVEDHQRNDARQIDGDPGAAVGARGPSMGESSTARSNDAPSGVAAICRAKPPPEEKPSKTNPCFWMLRAHHLHENGHVVVKLARIVDVPVPPAAAMATDVGRIDSEAGRASAFASGCRLVLCAEEPWMATTTRSGSPPDAGQTR